MRRLVASILVLAILAPMPAMAHDGPVIAAARKINFPKLPDGRSVLAVDLHTSYLNGCFEYHFAKILRRNRRRRNHSLTIIQQCLDIDRYIDRPCIAKCDP